MRKSKAVKMLVLALALVMVFSVTASAITNVSWSVSGKTARGTLGTKNATTSYETVAGDIYAEIDYYYRIASSDEIHMNSNMASNAGTSVSAYTDVLSKDQGKTVSFHNSYGTHRVNGSTRNTNYY